MTEGNSNQLRRGWTTGACATAALKAALLAHWGGVRPDRVTITLPRGETPDFAIAHFEQGEGWTEAGVTKDAGDDPDVTHGALIKVRIEAGTGGISFHAGCGVGTITKPGLPIEVGQAAINPVPRQMMQAVVQELAADHAQPQDVAITISVPGGQELAAKTWNPRLGIVGGISILGTTGIVRPFSCAAWIASIHRGIDVARAEGLTHVAGCTGATSEAAVQAHLGLGDSAMLDMGDFVGGMLKYLRKHPVAHVTIGGGLGKMTKLAQGARDLHSGRSQVDFNMLAGWMAQPDVAEANSVLEVHRRHKDRLVEAVGARAAQNARLILGPDFAGAVSVVLVDRDGAIVGQASA